MTSFKFDLTRPIHLALRGGSHTFAMTYSPDGVPIVAVYVGDRLFEPAFTMIRPDIAKAIGALLATHAEMNEKAQALVTTIRNVLDEPTYNNTAARLRVIINTFATDFQLDD